MDNSFLKPEVAARLVADFRKLEQNPTLATINDIPRREFLLRIAAMGQFFGTEDLGEIIAALQRIAAGESVPLAVVPTNIQELVEDLEKEQALEKRGASPEERLAQVEGSVQHIREAVSENPEIEKVVYRALETPAEPQPADEAASPVPEEGGLAQLRRWAADDRRAQLVRALEGPLGEETAQVVTENIGPYLAAWGQQGKIDPENLKNLLTTTVEGALPPQTSKESVAAKMGEATEAVFGIPFVSSLLPQGFAGLGEVSAGRQTPPPPPREEEGPAPQDQKDTKAAREARLLLLVSYHRPFFLREVANTIVGLPFIKPWQILYAIGREDYARAHPGAAVAIDLFWTHGITADSVSRAIAVLRAEHPDLPANSPVLRGATSLLQSLREYETERPRISFFLKALRPRPDIELVEEVEGTPREGVPPSATKRPTKVIRAVSRHEGENISLLRAEQVEQKGEEEKEPGTSPLKALRNFFRGGGKRGELWRLFRKELNRWARRQVGRLFRQTLGRLTSSLKNFFSSAAKRLFGKLSSSIFNFFAGKKVVVRQVVGAAQRGLFGFIRSAAEQIGSFVGRAATTLGKLFVRGASMVVKALGHFVAIAVKALLQLGVRLATLVVRAVAAAVQAVAAALSTPVGWVFLAVVAIIVGILLIVIAFQQTSSSLGMFVEEGRPEALREAVESPFIGVSLAAAPKKIDNANLPTTVQYSLAVTAKQGALASVSLDTRLSLFGALSNLLPATPAVTLPQTVGAGESKTTTFTLEIKPEIADSLLITTITVTADVEGGPTGEKAAKTASVVVGNPPTECLTFEDDAAGWSEEGQAMIIEALGIIAQSPVFMSQLCGTGPIRLQHWAGSQYGGYAPGGDGPDKDLVVIYDLGLSSQDVALYTLAHELGHLYDYRNGGARPLFEDVAPFKADGRFLETYPNPQFVGPFEDFAETIADYIVWKVYSFKDLGRLNMPQKYPAHYSFAKEHIFGGFEY